MKAFGYMLRSRSNNPMSQDLQIGLHELERRFRDVFPRFYFIVLILLILLGFLPVVVFNIVSIRFIGSCDITQVAIFVSRMQRSISIQL